MEADKTLEINEDSHLTAGQLAQAVPCSRFKIRRCVRLGYEFQYGDTTSLRHLRGWMEENRDLFKRKPLAGENLARMKAVAASARELKRLKSAKACDSTQERQNE